MNNNQVNGKTYRAIIRADGNIVTSAGTVYTKEEIVNIIADFDEGIIRALDDFEGMDL